MGPKTKTRLSSRDQRISSVGSINTLLLSIGLASRMRVKPGPISCCRAVPIRDDPVPQFKPFGWRLGDSRRCLDSMLRSLERQHSANNTRLSCVQIFLNPGAVGWFPACLSREDRWRGSSVVAVGSNRLVLRDSLPDPLSRRSTFVP